MADYLISTERTLADLVLFAAGFAGFIISASGIVVASVPTAVFGAVMFLIVVLCFRYKAGPEAG